MRIAIIGAGAIGCFFGSRLAASGHEVLLIHHKKSVVARIRKHGVILRERSGSLARQKIDVRQSVQHRDDPDFVILTVKAFDTDEAAQFQLKPARLRATVLTLQNGLGNVEILQRHLSSRFLIAGSTTEGVTAMGPGVVNHMGSGTTWIGELNGNLTDRSRAIKNIFYESGLRTLLSDNIFGVLWLKAIVNSAINPISSLVRTRNLGLLKRPELYDACIKVASEGMDLARANGIELPESPVSMLRRVLISTADNKSSMLQDIESGRQSEIRQLNGILSEKGNMAGLSASCNELLTKLVHGLEKLRTSDLVEIG